MTDFNFWHAVGPSLTTGVLVAAISVLATFIAQGRLGTRIEQVKQELAGALASRARHADYLRLHLENLYGPLAFFMEMNEQLTLVHQHINATYDKYFERGAYDRDEPRAVIRVANVYGRLMVQNNRETAAAMKANWAYIDQDDIEQCAEFLKEVARHEVEFNDDEAQRRPPGFYRQESGPLRAPFIHWSPLANRLRSKLKAKQEELGDLHTQNR